MTKMGRMTFEEAMSDSCRELGFDNHIKNIRNKKDCNTYAEKLVCNFNNRPFSVKNSYMYLDGVDFCFFNYKNEVNFAISGVIARHDKIDICNAINKALELCDLCEQKLKAGERNDTY